MKRFIILFCFLDIGFLILGPGPILSASRQDPDSLDVIGGGVFEANDATGVLEIYFEKIAGDRHKRIDVKDVRIYEKILLPPGTVSCDIILPEQAHRGGNISGAILFRVHSQEVKRSRFSARVDIYADIVVAKGHLKKYHEIEKKDVQLVNRNISFLPQDVITEVEDMIGKRTTLSINNDEIIRAGMVEIPPVIKKGDRVTLVVESQQFKITTLAEAKEEGRKGDRVRLVNLSSRREVSGRVLDANTVQIDY